MPRAAKVARGTTTTVIEATAAATSAFVLFDMLFTSSRVEPLIGSSVEGAGHVELPGDK